LFTLRQVGRNFVCAGVVLSALWWCWAPRPAFLPLATRIDGPGPARASRVVVFLHGRGGGLGAAERSAKELRAAGLPADVSLVLVEGPFATWFGHQWGSSWAAQRESRARLRAVLDGVLRGCTLPPPHLVVAGFSQGAGVALDLAAEDKRIGRVASFAPCQSELRAALPKRDGLQFLLVHGRSDQRCPVEESVSLARVLKAAGRPVEYVEFAGGHEMPPATERTLVEFVTAD
jgi:predicted esterase